MSTGTYARVLEPPAQYARPYLGDLQVKYVNREVAQKACGRYGIACAFPLGSKCLIVMNIDYIKHKNALLRHEQAHCLGWPGTHPRS